MYSNELIFILFLSNKVINQIEGLALIMRF